MKKKGNIMTSTARRLGVTIGLAVVLSTSVSAIAIAEDKDLIIFDWSGYEDPAFHPGYVAKYGESPTFTFFGDEDEAFQKMRSGFKTDLAHPCSQSVVKWREAGLLQPLDTSKIEGWNDLEPRHHEDEGSGDHRRRHGLVPAVGLGQHAGHLQFREGRREGHRSR